MYRWKKLESRAIFGEDRDESTQLTFCGHPIGLLIAGQASNDSAVWTCNLFLPFIVVTLKLVFWKVTIVFFNSCPNSRLVFGFFIICGTFYARARRKKRKSDLVCIKQQESDFSDYDISLCVNYFPVWEFDNKAYEPVRGQYDQWFGRQCFSILFRRQPLTWCPDNLSRTQTDRTCVCGIRLVETRWNWEPAAVWCAAVRRSAVWCQDPDGQSRWHLADRDGSAEPCW